MQGLSFQLWPSALALTGYLEGRHAKEPGLWQGKRILELGAGMPAHIYMQLFGLTL